MYRASLKLSKFQEVDHFKLLEKALGSVGYSGRFLPKPDSPCIYLTGTVVIFWIEVRGSSL